MHRVSILLTASLSQCGVPPSIWGRPPCTIRSATFSSASDYTLLAATGFAGSRSGALIATAWASMVHLGEAGFLDITKRIMQARFCRLDWPRYAPFCPQTLFRR